MENFDNIVIVKKDGTIEPFKPEKIKKAVSKSAARVMINFTEDDLNNIINTVLSSIKEKNLTEVKIPEMHDLVVLSILLRPSVSTKNNSLSIISLLHSFISKLFFFAISSTVIGPYKSHPFVIVVCISLKGLNGPFNSK